jgi:hypothetical protein
LLALLQRIRVGQVLRATGRQLVPDQIVDDDDADVDAVHDADARNTFPTAARRVRNASAPAASRRWRT